MRAPRPPSPCLLPLSLVLWGAACASGASGGAGSGGRSGGSGGATGSGGSAGAAATGGVTGGSGGSSGGAGGAVGTGGAPGGGGSSSTGGAGGGGGGATGGGAGAGASMGGAGAGGAAGRSGSGGAGGRGGGAAGGRGGGGAGGAQSARPLEEVQRAYIDLRFGMFIHFGILTYTGTWSQANLPINMFNPTMLDPGQWADAAVAARMKYGVLTTKHHDGFALWPSAVSTFDVGSISWRNGQGDVVREYVDAFRARGLLPGLYYSVWDNTQGTGNGSTITRAQIDYVKAQLTELLTNYGPIPIIVFDGWSWKMGHKAMPYQEIRALVKSLQPNCLMLDHSHLMSPWDADVAAIEEPKGAFAPADNTFPATQGQKINASGGNDWFWAPGLGGLMSVTDIVDGHLEMLEARWTNFLLNCPPNRDGLMDAAIVTRLGQVGAAWSPNAARPPLPAQGPQNERPYTPVSATASSGTAANAIDGKNDWGSYTVWQTSGALPQSITIDLGQIRPDVAILTYVPRYGTNGSPSTADAITSYAISTSTDNSTFTAATTGTWPATGKMKAATFAPVAARYVRLEARAVMSGTAAAATEITVGGAP
jgi:alpha-L-fucosidase